MTWLEMVACYKGYRNLLRDDEPIRPVPIWNAGASRAAKRAPAHRGRRTRQSLTIPMAIPTAQR